MPMEGIDQFPVSEDYFPISFTRLYLILLVAACECSLKAENCSSFIGKVAIILT